MYLVTIFQIITIHVPNMFDIPNNTSKYFRNWFVFQARKPKNHGLKFKQTIYIAFK